MELKITEEEYNKALPISREWLSNSYACFINISLLKNYKFGKQTSTYKQLLIAINKKLHEGIFLKIGIRDIWSNEAYSKGSIKGE